MGIEFPRQNLLRETPAFLFDLILLSLRRVHLVAVTSAEIDSPSIFIIVSSKSASGS